MDTSLMEHVRTHHLENEFIPPLSARDTWGVPWERQLEAHSAWQRAGGNTDGEACQWADPAIGTIVPQRTSPGSWQSRSKWSDGNRIAANDARRFFDRRHRQLAIGFPDRRPVG